jgi:hypothetical protein
MNFSWRYVASELNIFVVSLLQNRKRLFKTLKTRLNSGCNSRKGIWRTPGHCTYNFIKIQLLFLSEQPTTQHPSSRTYNITNTKVRLLTLSRTISTYFTRSILILSSNLIHGLPSGRFSRRFSNKILYVFLISPTRGNVQPIVHSEISLLGDLQES